MDVMKKVPVREQDPKVRATNFEEVCYGYNEEEAVAEDEVVASTEDAVVEAPVVEEVAEEAAE
jgi:hypothetical protein